MKQIINLMLIALLAFCASGEWRYKTLRDMQGNITYNDFKTTDHNDLNPITEYSDNHVLFIHIRDVSMYRWKVGNFGYKWKECTADLYLPGRPSICLTPEVRCLFYQPIGCNIGSNFDFVTDFNGFECDKYAWFVLPKLPATLKIYKRRESEKVVQLQYKYFECLKKISSTVTDASTVTNPDSTTLDYDHSLSTNEEIVKTDSGTEMFQGKMEMTAGLSIAVALLVVSWVVFGVVYMRNRSKATSRKPDVKETEAEESNTREIVVNAIYGENFERMGDDSQQTSSSAVYSVVQK
uniref:uncharacterized protein LOC120347911 n=1 Tax=Styela clava TaxID=7725 RepID=UPI00193A7880|nr:uncharacterized protein LOC120347911 [Styela clava]